MNNHGTHRRRWKSAAFFAVILSMVGCQKEVRQVDLPVDCLDPNTEQLILVWDKGREKAVAGIPYDEGLAFSDLPNGSYRLTIDRFDPVTGMPRLTYNCNFEFPLEEGFDLPPVPQGDVVVRVIEFREINKKGYAFMDADFPECFTATSARLFILSHPEQDFEEGLLRYKGTPSGVMVGRELELGVDSVHYAFVCYFEEYSRTITRFTLPPSNSPHDFILSGSIGEKTWREFQISKPFSFLISADVYEGEHYELMFETAENSSYTADNLSISAYHSDTSTAYFDSISFTSLTPPLHFKGAENGKLNVVVRLKEESNPGSFRVFLRRAPSAWFDVGIDTTTAMDEFQSKTFKTYLEKGTYTLTSSVNKPNTGVPVWYSIFRDGEWQPLVVHEKPGSGQASTRSFEMENGGQIRLVLSAALQGDPVDVTLLLKPD